MTKLTFTQANENSFSPVKLSFNVPVQLAFSTPYESPTSPIKLTFEGVPIVRPEEPEQVGMFTTFSFKNDKSLIQKKYKSGWTFGNALRCSYSLAWGFKSVGTLTQLRYKNYTQLLKKQFDLHFKNGALIGVKTDLSFTVPVLIKSYAHINWSNNKPLLITETSIAFNQCEQLYTSNNVVWKSSKSVAKYLNITWHDDAEILPTYLTMNYGFESLNIVCSWEQHPEKGLVVLAFNSAPVQQNPPLNLQLNTDGKVCELQRTEPFLQAQDEYPVIDLNVPIQPQLQSSYIMEPSLVCIRVSDDLEIVISDFSYQISRSQFAAAVSIKFGSRIDYERSLNELLKVTMNGYEFFVLVGAGTKSLSFNQSSYSAVGKSRIAELAEPNARAISYTNENGRSFVGLASDILQNTGWTVLSNIVDYSVPAFALSYQELTPVEALKYLADSIGAMLVTDDVTQTVTFTPVWPVMPWTTDDATPDIVINESLILSHNTTDIISPLHNVVMVRGEQSGVQCKVKLTDTLADQYASDVTNALITHEQAARQRGSYVLANAGNKEKNDIRTKIMPTLPPIKPGMLLGIQYSDSVYKATCDSATYSASTDRQGRLTVNQSFTVLKRTA